MTASNAAKYDAAYTVAHQAVMRGALDALGKPEHDHFFSCPCPTCAGFLAGYSAAIHQAVERFCQDQARDYRRQGPDDTVPPKGE